MGEKRVLVADMSDKHACLEIYDSTEKLSGGRLLALELYLQFKREGHNPLVFATSRLNTTSLRNLASKTILAGKSPVNDNICTSASGGHFGPALATKDLDALVIVGSSKVPATFDLESQNFTEHVQRSRAIRQGASAGAGVRFATAIDYRGIHGRGGFGYAMRQRGLRAIAYDIDEVKQTEGQIDFGRAFEEFMREEQGIQSAGRFRPFQDSFDGLAVRRLSISNNFEPLTPKDRKYARIAEQLRSRHGEEIHQYDDELYPVRFPGRVKILRPNGEEWVKGPYNQTATILGTNLGLSNLNEIYTLAHLCDTYGIDTLTFGATLSALMEMRATGELNFADFDGVDLRFGNYKSILGSLEKMIDSRDLSEYAMALRRGMNGVLDTFDGDNFAMQVRGQSLSAYHVAEHPFLALLFAVSSRGPDHFRGARFTGIKGENVADAMYQHQRGALVCDALGIDRFSGMTCAPKMICAFANSVGVEICEDDFDRLALKTLVLERVAYLENGGRGFDDDLPPKLERQMMEAKTSGSQHARDYPEALTYKNFFEYFLKNKQEYYERVGFDKQGIPTAKTLADLGIMRFSEAKCWHYNQKRRH